MHFVMHGPAGEAVEITDHAVDRWLERVEPRVTRTEAAAHIAAHARAIRAAAAFGANIVRLATGHRLILAPGEPRVVTVQRRHIIPDFHGRAFPTQPGWGQA